MPSQKEIKRNRRHQKISAINRGSKDRPRLVVFRSNKNLQAQLIDDEAGKTLVSASDMKAKKGSNVETAKNVKDLEAFSSGATVDVNSLLEKGLVAKKNLPVKILGDGDLSKKLTVKADSVSKSAEDKIKKAGGTCEVTMKKKEKIEAKSEPEPAKEEPKEEKAEAKEPPTEKPEKA
ncbi:uL15 family ribosomal protein [Patescibacteria group bacterium]